MAESQAQRHPGLIDLPPGTRRSPAGRREAARRIRLRGRAWHEAAAAAELWTLAEQGLALGISSTAIHRVLTGQDAPGTRFIAGSLAAFPHLRFEDMFESVPLDAADDDAEADSVERTG